jgi:hypothetical protein
VPEADLLDHLKRRSGDRSVDPVTAPAVEAGPPTDEVYRAEVSIFRHQNSETGRLESPWKRTGVPK